MKIFNVLIVLVIGFATFALIKPEMVYPYFPQIQKIYPNVGRTALTDPTEAAPKPNLGPKKVAPAVAKSAESPEAPVVIPATSGVPAPAPTNRFQGDVAGTSAPTTIGARGSVSRDPASTGIAQTSLEAPAVYVPHIIPSRKPR